MKPTTQYVQCRACSYHWAWLVSPNFCPQCAGDSFTEWTPPAPATPDPRRTATTHDMVFLADNEWGNQIMREIAAEWFAAHPDCQFVHVYEHAGWSLMFHRAALEVVGTANDRAVMRADRPVPSHYSGICHRRPTTRPDLGEIESLAEYQTPKPLLRDLVEEMARELAVPVAELTA